MPPNESSVGVIQTKFFHYMPWPDKNFAQANRSPITKRLTPKKLLPKPYHGGFFETAGEVGPTIDPGTKFTITVQEKHDWCSVFLPFDVLNHDFLDANSLQFARPCSRVVDVGHNAMVRLRSALSKVIDSVNAEPTVLAAPAAAIAPGI